MLSSSFGYETLHLYERIDSKIEGHYKEKKKKAPCVKGCSSCCSQFFEISEVEYMIILNHIKEWDEAKLENLIVTAELCMKILEKHHNQFYLDYFSEDAPVEFSENNYYRNSERYKIHIPCVFLSEEGACTIYQSRPLVCRTTGVGYKMNFEFGSVCREIRSIFWARRWQADLREFQNEILSVNWLETGTDEDDPDYEEIELRQYPMFYYVNESFLRNKSGFSDPRLHDYFNLSKEALMKRLIARHLK